MEFDKNIVLIGFMGSGKSSVSRKLNKIYGMDIVEMDELISKREGMSIPDIFSSKGEEYFRDCETDLLKELQTHKKTVVSCGGGVPMRDRNVAEMKRIGKVVLLTASPESIFERVRHNQNRPLLKGNMNVEYIKKLMESRWEKYQAAADIVINTDGKDTQSICREVMEAVENG